MKLKPFKMWLLWDAEDSYMPSLYGSRKHALEEKERSKHLRDAKWRVTRVVVRPALSR